MNLFDSIDSSITTGDYDARQLFTNLLSTTASLDPQPPPTTTSATFHHAVIPSHLHHHYHHSHTFIHPSQPLPSTATAAANTTTSASALVPAPVSVCIDNHVHSDGLREIGDLCVWSLSSAKHGNGVHELRDDDLDTYWQSDGQSPHIITCTFPHRRQAVKCIGLYVDYKLDESYTPAKISIRTSQYSSSMPTAAMINSSSYYGAGGAVSGGMMYSPLMQATTSLNNTTSVERQCIELEEPTGWISIFLDSTRNCSNDSTDADDDDYDVINGCDRVCSVEIVILASHQNGRDTHIRQCKIFAPITPETVGHNTQLSNFTSPKFQQFATIR